MFLSIWWLSCVLQIAWAALPAAECQEAAADTSGKCAEGKCDVWLNNRRFCSRCATLAEHIIDGGCVTTDDSTNNCVSDATGACASCKSGYFLHKGGCYKLNEEPGNFVCGDASAGSTAGICSACKDVNGFFKNPSATVATKQSCIACNDTTGADYNLGVEGCTACSGPDSAGSQGAPKTTTCSACSNSKIVKTDKGVTSCVTDDECTKAEGFFVKGSGGSKACEACDSMCKTCSGAATQCTSCNTDKPYLKKTQPTDQTGTCTNEQECTNDSTYYADDTVDLTSGKLCRKCAEGGLKDCATCVKSADDLVCKECAGKKFGLNKKSCVTECPDNASEKSGVCTCNDGFTPSTDSTACVAASSSGPNLSTGAIAGISVVAVLVVSALIGFLCWWFLCKTKRGGVSSSTMALTRPTSS